MNELPLVRGGLPQGRGLPKAVTEGAGSERKKRGGCFRPVELWGFGRLHSFRFAGSSPRSLGQQVLTFQPGLSGVSAKAAPLREPDSLPAQANPASGSSRKHQLGLGAKGDACKTIVLLHP